MKDIFRNLKTAFFNFQALRKAKIKDVIIDECYLQAFERIVRKSEYKPNNERHYYSTSNENVIVLFEDRDQNKFNSDWKIYFENRDLKVSDLEFWVVYLELKNSGYLETRWPNKNHIKLTKKGMNHYETGSSFKQRYIDNIITYASLAISIVALVVSLAT